jgi:hypothetical protein
MTGRLTNVQEAVLKNFANSLVDQEAAKPVVIPIDGAPGFWFGGGNMIKINENLYLCGRYRNYGDSRVGTDVGTRGFELAIFRSADSGISFEKVKSFSKHDLSHSGLTVKSIEGSFLHSNGKEVELFVSTEKIGIPYPEDLGSFQKPNTGVWTIDKMAASSIEALEPESIEGIIVGEDPRYLHIKDPLGYPLMNGDFMLLFCTHPFSWSSSNTGYIVRKSGGVSFGLPNFTFFPRGTTWDVAITRGTCLLRVPRIGTFADAPMTTLIFYDGGESLRNLDEHKNAVSRPRGYSCEELGGAAYLINDDFNNVNRLSINFPLFISPYGLGTSRYVDVLETNAGYYATWQQSQKDGSQPLVMNFLTMDRVNRIFQRGS